MGMQLHMIPSAISASLGKRVWVFNCGIGLKGRGNCLRPESKRDKIVCQIVASDDLEANDSTFEAGYTRAVFRQLWYTFAHRHFSVSWGAAYNIAVAKTTEMPIFRFKGICKDDTQKRGIIKIMTSEMTFIIEDTQMSLEISRQRPGVRGSHILRRGIHVKITTSVAAR